MSLLRIIEARSVVLKMTLCIANLGCFASKPTGKCVEYRLCKLGCWLLGCTAGGLRVQSERCPCCYCGRSAREAQPLSQAAEAVPPVGSMSSLGFTLGRVVLCLLVCMPATVPGVFAVSVFVHTVSEVLSPISCEVVSSKASES